MRDLIGKYNRNRKIIWIIIGICVAFYAIIHIINFSIEKSRLTTEKQTNNVKESIFYKTNYAVTSDKLIDLSVNEGNTKIIKEFIKNCNEKKVDEAYNLISDECKKVLYPTQEVFEKEYLNNIFQENKTYKLQLWTEDDIKFTYRVELMSDILATGGVVNTSKIDYYTIVKEGENLKLNISGFVEKEELNITNENEIIKINVKNIEKYVDYSNINIDVYNKTNSTILLDGGKKGDSVFATDSKNNTYASFLFEVTDYDLLIEKNMKKDFSIKFQKTFDRDINIKQIAFTDIVTNYEKENEKRNQKLIIELTNKI